MYLENGISTQPTVQECRDMTTSNGCKVTLVFSPKSNPQARRDVAGMLLAAFERRRSNNHEASTLPVQSIHQRTGG